MPGSVFSDHKYIEYQPGGATNIILTVPHGGHLRPGHIPPRDAGADVGGVVVYRHGGNIAKDAKRFPVRYKKDTYTQELGLMIADELECLMRARPHVVLCHLYRGKLDVNCDLEKATFRVPEAEQAWYRWHDFIQQARSQIEALGMRGLMLDIHGHAHCENWVELGYTLSAQQLNEKTYSAAQTSIRGLIDASKLPHCEVIQGHRSLGALISRHGYKVVPSPEYPGPGNGNYYTGGFNTTHHGSHSGGLIDAIQLEIPSSLRNARAAPKYAEIMASSLVEFLEMNSAPK